jgi:hypothetical protein
MLIPSLDERRSHAPVGKRPHPPGTGKTEGKIKGRDCETLGMKGWRPSAIAKGSKPGSGFLRTNSCRTSDRSACLFPRVSGSLSVDAGSLFALNQAQRPPGRAETPPERPRLKNGASPSPRSKGKAEMKTNEPKPRRTGSAGPVASFRAGSGATRKGPGRRRNPLITFDSAKEIQGFPWLDFVGLCWMRPGFGVGLDLAWQKSEFNPRVRSY